MMAPPWVKFLINDIVNMPMKTYDEDEIESSFDSYSESETYQKKLAKKAGNKKPKLYSKDIEIA